MKVQRFVAPTKREAIDAVRRYFGSEAVILSDRRTPGGIELVATAHDPDAPDGVSEMSSRASASASAYRGTQVQPDASQTDNASLHTELQNLRTLVEDQIGGLLWKDAVRSQPYRSELLRRLLAFGVSMQLCNALADAVEETTSAQAAWVEAITHLVHRVTIGAPHLLDRGGVAALVGPTGVGKTTTMAKLAGQFLMRHGPGSVAMVTTDDYRLGAQEQLLAFARILDVPVLQARDQDELEACVASLQGCALTLIDTEGLKNAPVLSAETAPARDFHYDAFAEVYLLVQAGASNTSLAACMRSLQGVRISGCIMTKLDECPSMGSVLCNSIRHQLPLTFLTDGQQVPIDLHAASQKDLLEFADSFHDPDEALEVDDRLLAASFSHIRTTSHV